MTLLYRLRQFSFPRALIIYFIISQAVILFSNHQFYQVIAATPPGKINVMIHRDWPQDYYSQLAYITEGASGAWLRYAPYAVEPTKPGFFHIFYIYIGKIGNTFHFSPQGTYHIARFFSLEFFVLGLYAAAREFLGKKDGYLGALFAILATFGPEKVLPQKIQITWYPQGYPWWESLDSLERLYMPPHYIFGQALLLWVIYFIFRWLKQANLNTLLLAIGAFLAGALTFPPMIIPFGIAPVPAYGIMLLRRFVKRLKPLFNFRLLFIVSILSLLVLFVYVLQTYQESLGFPWNFTKQWEIARWNHEPSFDIAMPYLFGLLPVLALPAIIRAFLVGTWPEIFMAIWALIPYFMLPLADILQFPKIRLVHENPYVPFAFLAVESLIMLEKTISKSWFRNMFILLFVLSTVPVSLYHLYYRIRSVDYFTKNGDTRQFYIPEKMYESFSFLRTQIPRRSPVISDYQTGSLLIAFAPVISFIGSQDVIDADSKRFFTERFLSSQMTDREAYIFLKNYSLKYVYYGPYEKPYGGNMSKYSFLEPVYAKNDITIYKMKE